MWILALARNLEPANVDLHLAVTCESPRQDLELLSRMEALGFRCHRIRMAGRFDPRVIPALSHVIRENRIQVIHTHGYKSDILGLAAARLSGIRSVSTPHGFENAPDPKLQLFIRAGCLALRHFDRVAPLSEELAADIRRIGVAPERIRLILNGVDLSEIEKERPHPVPEQYRDNGEKRIGYVGQIAHRKNVRDLITAFDLLHGDHPHCRLMLVGDGPQRRELEEYARSLKSSAGIELLGYRPDRLQFMKAMDVFCMSSSLEGIPRCMMEAMALGRPVAAYRIPGVDRLIIHEKTGLMADFGDVEGLKGCMEKLLFDRALAEALAEAGRRHVTETFSAERMAQEYGALYRRIIGEHQPVVA